MSDDISPIDWATERGEKWEKQLLPLETMLAPIDKPLIVGLDLNASYCIADLGCHGLSWIYL